MLYLERRRSERSRRRYVLFLLDIREAITGKQKFCTAETIGEAICAVTRETDIVGWHDYDHILGVIVTEIGNASVLNVRAKILQKLSAAIVQALGSNLASKISISFHFFPDEQLGGEGVASAFFPCEPMGSAGVRCSKTPPLNPLQTATKLARPSPDK